MRMRGLVIVFLVVAHRDGRPVEFSIATSSTNRQRLEMATIIQADLKELGINVKVVPMEKQLVTIDYAQRRRLFDRVQALVAEHLPFVFVAAPNILVGARGDLGNFRPAVLDTSGLWNADQLFLRPRAAVQRTSR